MAAWIPAGTGPCLLLNERTGRTIATSVELAVTRRTRRVGLLGRAALDEAAALVLAPCRAIHTAGMRFPIDVVFVDRHGCALRVVRDLKPWRIALAPRAYAAIELSGGVTRDRVGTGDTLCLVRAVGRVFIDPPHSRVQPASAEASAVRRAGPRKRTGHPALASRVAQRPDLGEGGKGPAYAPEAGC